MTQTDLDDNRSGGRPDGFTAGRMSPLRSPAALTAAGLLVGLLVVLGGLVLARSGSPLPGTTVEGVAVGGLSEADLREAIDQQAELRRSATIQVEAVGRSFTWSPGTEGYAVDTDATVDAALSAGRGGLGSVLSHVTATFGAGREIELVADPVDAGIEDFVTRVAAEIDQPVGAGAVTVDPETLQVSTTVPQPGQEVDVEGAVAAIRAVVGNVDPSPVTVPVQVVDPPTDEADVSEIAAQAEAAVAEPLLLSANGHIATVTPSEIARMLTSELTEDTLRLAVDPDELMTALEDDRSSMETEPVDATFTPSSEIPTIDEQGNLTWQPRPASLDIVPSTPGSEIDADDAARQVAALLADATRQADLELTEIEADLTTDEARALGITDLIGTFTTYHACCQNRVTNIQRMADLVRGTVIEPGDEFSINDDIGQRTIAKGFVADGAIFQGEIRDEVGGGVSQFATTMYNASFFAGIPILEHQPHSLYISRYPRGREATLNYDSIDLRIRNDTEHGIYVHTSYTGRSITVSLFGDNGGREVTAIMGEPYDFGGFSTRRRTNPALPQGQERVVQSGVGSYRVTVERIIREDGDERSEDIVTLYTGRPEIIEVGTGPPATPTPDPSAGPTGDPTAEPDPEPDPEPSPTPAPSSEPSGSE